MTDAAIPVTKGRGEKNTCTLPEHSVVGLCTTWGFIYALTKIGDLVLHLCLSCLQAHNLETLYC